MRRRTIIGVVISLTFAAVFVRLGIWQLQRLAQRRAYNAQLEHRLSEPPLSLAALPADTERAKYRRVHVSGTYDYDHEIVLTGRSRDGSPGVYLLTPLKPDGGGRAVLVDRGWVYSPDAFTVDAGRWREPEHAVIEGYVGPFAPRQAREPRSPSHPNAWRSLDGSRLPAAFPYPIAPYYVVALPAGDRPLPGAPVRQGIPAMGEGPHKSYAIQWFSFAAIALAGVAFLVHQEREARAPRG